MKRTTFIVSAIVASLALSITINSCKPTAAITAKSGAQIWGENCVRCHNTASPETFSDIEWDVTATHMQIRANLTHEESRKVLEFLKAAN